MPFPIAAAISAGASLFNSFMNNGLSNKQYSQQKELAELQMSHNKQLMNLQNSQNIQNAINAGTYERLSKQKAGLNLNSEGGFSPIAGASSPGVSQGSAPATSPVDFASFINSASQAILAQKQASNIEEDTKRKKLENQGTEEENRWYSWSMSPEFNDLEYNKELNGFILPNVEMVTIPSKTRKGVEARELAKARINEELHRLEMSLSQSELAQMVADGQLKDNEVVRALQRLPQAQYDEVMKRISEISAHIQVLNKQGNLLVTENELKKLEKEFSPKALLDGILKNPLDISEYFKTLLALIFKKAFGK